MQQIIRILVFVSGILCGLSSMAQLGVMAYIHHIPPNGVDSLGDIILQTFGGTPPYTYVWSNGTYPGNKDRMQVPADVYKLNLNDADKGVFHIPYSLGYKTNWAFFNNSTARHDSLLSGGADAVTYSANQLLANTDGWAELVISAGPSDPLDPSNIMPYQLGFVPETDDGFDNSLDHNLDFGFYVDQFNHLYVVTKYYFDFLLDVEMGSAVKIERLGSDYNLYYNGTKIYTIGEADPSEKLVIKAYTTSDMLMNLGCSFFDQSSSGDLHAVAKLQHVSNDAVVADGKIALYISGGKPPYTVSWPDSVGKRVATGLAPNTYSVFVQSVDDDRNYTYAIGYQTDWEFFNGAAFRNDSLLVDSSYSDAPVAISKNKLNENTQGWAEFIVGDYTAPSLFGFIDGSAEETTGTEAVIFGFYIGEDNALYSYYDDSYHSEGITLTAGDVIKIGRNGYSFYLTRNGSGIVNPGLSTSSLKLKAELGGNLFVNAGTSFNLPLQLSYSKNDQLSDQPNSGYIYVEPKYGVKPYSYAWSNSTTDNVLTDLATGTYDVVVTDAAGNSISQSFNIGYDTQWSHISNMNLNSDGNYAVLDKDVPASAYTGKYITNTQSGYYDLTVLNANANFNFIMQPYNTTMGLTGTAPTVVRQSIIKIATSDLPSKTSSAYNLINFADTIREGDSLNVIQKEFVSYPCNRCSRASVSGIQVDYGLMYALNNGVTIQKGVAIQNGDVIRFQSTSGVVSVLKNGTSIAQEGFTHLVTISTPLIGNINLYDLLGGPKDNFVRGVTGGPVNLGSGGAVVDGNINTNVPDNHPSEGCSACSGDATINSVQTTVYNDAGAIISMSKEYYDYRGAVKQSQVKNLTENKVIVTQPLFDAYGRNVGQSLPAPINTACFCYMSDFIISSSSGTPYTYNDFDVPNYTSNSSLLTTGEINKPAAVSASMPYRLGWYYSDNNTWEQYVPTAQTPYSRIQYSPVDASSVLRVSKPGDKLNSGSSHETYTFKMATSGELNTVFGSGLGWRIDNFTDFNNSNACTDIINPVPLINTAPLSMKSISVDENGVENITFMDLTGNIIATCMSGKVNGANVNTQTIKGWLSFGNETQRYVDVHLPDGCENSLVISAPVMANSPSTQYAIYNIINLKTGEYVRNTGANSNDWYSTINSSIQPVLNAGYYRIFVKSLPAIYAAGNGGVEITYTINYYNYALNYYDYANRLKAVVPPAGLTPTIYNTIPTHGNNRQLIRTITSGANTPAYFPVGKTWSTSSDGFSDKISLALPTQTANKEATSLDVTISNRAAMVKGNDATASPTVSTGNYNLPEYVMDTSVVVSIPDSAIIVSTKSVRFHVKVALLDSKNNVIDGTIQESTNLVCTLQYDAYNNQYSSWTPVTFNFIKQSNLSASPVQWDKLKIMTLEPTEPSLGSNYDVYGNLVNNVVITLNTLRLSSTTTPVKAMAERYRYDSWSNMVCSVSPDEGRSDVVYTLDGRPKYTRNAHENASNSSPYYRKYSFSSCDNLGRPLYGGENDPSTQTGGTKVYFEAFEDQGTLASGAPTGAVSVYNYGSNDLFDPTTWTGGTSEMVEMHYDAADPNFWNENMSSASGLSASVYVQRHLSGRLSYSKNDKKKTWYSYDEYGRTEWIVQKYIGVNPGTGGDIIKTFQYKYDASGNAGEIIYNTESTTDCLHHFYEYDQDNRLKRVYTQRSPVSPTTTSPKVLLATYDYYLHGPLKRAELGTKQQGLDYVYTINGWLKSMNSAEMDASYDPGRDGYVSNRVPNKDLFGFALEYYDGDYQRSGTNIQTYSDYNVGTAIFAPDQFNGVIKAQRWQTNVPASFTGLVYPNTQLMYGYSYDKKYQQLDAKFSPVLSNSSSGQLTIANINPLNEEYHVFNLAYDNNGNINSLKRNVYTGASGGLLMDNLSYVYNSCNNRLMKVTDGVTANPYNNLGFKPGQTDNNYIYDEIGELTSDASNNKKYEYNSLGNIIRIRDMSNNLVAEYDYDEAGYRIQKTAYLSSTSQKRTLYVRDDGGNIIATYEKTANGNTTSYSAPAEWDLYAAGRVGILDNTGGTESYIYEMADHLGNVRATFKPQAKTTISTNFDTHVSGNDDGWFNNTNNTLTNAFVYSANTANNYFVRTQKTSGAEYGAGSILIPVKYGNSVVISWKALWETGSVPNAGMEVKLTDAAGNPIGGTSGLQYFAMTSTGGTNHWQSYSQALNITANYPDMYLSFYPHNKDNFGAIAYFDELSLTFTSGAVNQPAMLNMADYYPHGSVMPGQNYTSSYKYRYGYQGQYAEMDDESNESNFELRNYDGLLGRFKTTDPYGQYWSPYLAMGNSHPNSIDPDGGWNPVMAIVGAGIGIATGITIDLINGKNMSSDATTATPLLLGAAGALIGGGFNATTLTSIKNNSQAFFLVLQAGQELAVDASTSVLNRGVGGHGYVGGFSPASFASENRLVGQATASGRENGGQHTMFDWLQQQNRIGFKFQSASLDQVDVLGADRFDATQTTSTYNMAINGRTVRLNNAASSSSDIRNQATIRPTRRVDPNDATTISVTKTGGTSWGFDACHFAKARIKVTTQKTTKATTFSFYGIKLGTRIR